MADEERPETIDETFERVEARARGERERLRSQPQPLTDEDLAQTERELAEEEADAKTGVGPALYEFESHARRLVAEIRRLRSDEWLDRAIDEMADTSDWFRGQLAQRDLKARLFAILRKHRDAKA